METRSGDEADQDAISRPGLVIRTGPSGGYWGTETIPEHSKTQGILMFDAWIYDVLIDINADGSDGENLLRSN